MPDKFLQIFGVILASIDDWDSFEELVLCTRSHAGQLEFLKNSVKRENALHAGNGFGKTDIIAKKHIRYILKHFADGDEYKTLNAAITADQSRLVQERILRICENSPLLKGWFVSDSVVFPQAEIRFCNGAITQFKTTKKKGEAIEGKEYGYISADEIALEQHLEFIRESILLPRLRRWSDSQLDFFATPKGMNAFFRVTEDIKRKGGYVRSGSSYENPHIDHTLLDYYRETWSQNKIDQVIFGKFIDTSGMMFASRVNQLFISESTLSDDCNSNSQYVEGWDLARGRKGKTADQTVGFRVEVTSKPFLIRKKWNFQLPWTEKSRENLNNVNTYKESSSTENEIRKAHAESKSSVYMDSTGVGDVLWEIVSDIARPVNFSGTHKDEILDNLQALIDCDLLKSEYIPELADEMTTYERNDTGLSTDNLMGLAVTCSSLRPFALKKAVSTNHR